MSKRILVAVLMLTTITVTAHAENLLSLNGNIGIGTTSPTQGLELANEYLYIKGSGGYGIWLENTYANKGKWELFQHNDGYLSITGGSPTIDNRLAITSDGKMGIGMTHTAKRLFRRHRQPYRPVNRLATSRFR